MNINDIDKKIIETIADIENVLFRIKLFDVLHNETFNFLISYIKNTMTKCLFLYIENRDIKENV